MKIQIVLMKVILKKIFILKFIKIIKIIILLIKEELHILVIVLLIDYQHFNKKLKINNNQENPYHIFKNLIKIK